MKAPNKIYVRIEEMGDVWALDATTWKNGGDEYIRKDALLEWAKESHDSGPVKDSADNGDAWSIGYLCGMADLIDRLKTF